MSMSSCFRPCISEGLENYDRVQLVLTAAKVFTRQRAKSRTRILHDETRGVVHNIQG
jgi:hypothetical protein